MIKRKNPPKNIASKKFESVFYKIIAENEQDTGLNIASKFLITFKEIEKLKNFIINLKSGLILCSYNHLGYKNIFKEIKYNFTNIQNLISYIKHRENELRQLEINYSNDIDKAKIQSELHNFYDELAAIQRLLKRNLDIERVTVKEWNAIVKDLKKAQKNGSKD